MNVCLPEVHKLESLCPNSTGTEFSAAQGHVKSFADQSFQSMKSKEVRDAGSPPKEFTYRGQGACTIHPTFLTELTLINR